MSQMTTHERFTRMFEHKEADRVPIIDSPWTGTILRWQKEGLGDQDWVEYFDIDRVASINVDISPRFESRVLEGRNSPPITPGASHCGSSRYLIHT